MLEAYRAHVAERATQGLPPLPLNAEQTAALVELIKAPPAGEETFLLDLLENRIPPGVDQAAYVKAAFLSDVAQGKVETTLVCKQHAVEVLGTMLGGYNVATLIALLDTSLAPDAVQALSHTALVFDAFHDVVDKMKAGNAHAKELMQSWADAEWFTRRASLPESIQTVVFKVSGETNTDDLSPAQEAWSTNHRPATGPSHSSDATTACLPDYHLQGVS